LPGSASDVAIDAVYLILVFGRQPLRSGRKVVSDAAMKDTRRDAA
jgi:hypothetical protein